MTAPRRFPGWAVVWVGFIVAVFAWGVGFYGPAVFLQTLHAERGWSISTLSAGITLHFLVSAAIVAYLPQFHRRFGIANTTLGGAVLSALGISAWANVREPWQIFLAALSSGAGWAVTSGAAIHAMIARWFERDLPKALSLALNGASVGGVVFAPLWVALISQIGFPMAALAVGITMTGTIGLLSARFLRYGPADMGLAPDGRWGTAVAPKQTAKLSRAELLRDRRFATISAAFALGLFAQIGLFVHLIARLTPELGTDAAAFSVSLTTICAVAGRSLLGWCIGERDRRIAAAANFSLQSFGVLLLSFGTSVPVLILGCVLFGLGVGNLIFLPPLIAQKEFDTRDVGTVVALVTAINQAVFALGPAVFGVLRDATGTYLVPFMLAAIAQGCAAMIVMIGRR